ncbi:hypothetical protein BLNAU_9583 [Blattamonas nauphoetae]|uniref:Uncharacterized protein n=1 Tax=Blattamonas nauphoetae TaxID=2049346 RepID=A0ABQ9XVP5_9EUKA|nr:hypothetical protein BLNAU_9583 [Blattamonas nauphoetae]
MCIVISTFSSFFVSESLKLLDVLHSLLPSPLPSTLPKYSRTDISDWRHPPFKPEPINPEERFKPSLFDEPDDEKLARSLVRCRSVCELDGAEKCIRDVPYFFDRTISALHTSDRLVRASALYLFDCLIDASCTIHLFPRLLNRLHSAFRDGHPEEQLALLWISTNWITFHLDDSYPPPFPAKQFDWDGLIKTDLSDWDTFVCSIHLILLIRNRSIEDQIGKDESTRIIFSFEKQHTAVSRILFVFDGTQPMNFDSHANEWLISYCLLISLLSDRPFPPTLTPIIAQDPELDGSYLLLHENKLFLLCHTSLNPHKLHQPPLDFVFERTLRKFPLGFFVHLNKPDVKSPLYPLNTSLCGFHALCRRGVHLNLMETEDVKQGNHILNSFWMFFTPLISTTFHLFLFYPPPLVTRFFIPILSLKPNHAVRVDPLREIWATLLVFTAPFGDLLSLRELNRSIDQRNTFDNMLELIFPSYFTSLEWLNIPTGFTSALAHSNAPASIDHFENQDGSPMSIDESLHPDRLSTIMSGFLSEQVRVLSEKISLVGSMVRDLNRNNAVSDILEDGTLWDNVLSMLSPVPAEVSYKIEPQIRISGGLLI